MSQPGNNLTIIPYVPTIAEYAAQVREEILRRRRDDFIIAVDLPAGLETQVIKATRQLPEASVVIDPLMRGIPIIPTSAPIEAVRSYLEYGLECRFIDASLPVMGNIEDYQHFVQISRHFGLEKVLSDPEAHGVNVGELCKAWIDPALEERRGYPFFHLPGVAASVGYPEYDPHTATPYLQTRLQCMARHLQRLLDTGIEVLFVCSGSLHHGVLHYIEEDLPEIDDSYIVPTRICPVKEADVCRITREIPFLMYLYDLYRDTPVEREMWIRNLYCGAETNNVSANTVNAAIDYAYSLAFTDRQVFPDIYNLIAAAKYTGGDDFAINVLESALSYPPNHTTEGECIIRPILDYNFMNLENARSITLRRSLFKPSSRITSLRERLNPVERRYYGYTRWQRTPESIQAEFDFMRYMTRRYVALEPSKEEWTVEEFSCGLGEGFDVKETLRNGMADKIFVREPALENVACYIIDYRDPSPESQPHQSHEGQSTSIIIMPGRKKTTFNDCIFFDRNYPWIGVTEVQGRHYTSTVMVAFNKLDRSPTQVFYNLVAEHPLTSAVHLATRYAKYVFIFTDNRHELNDIPIDSRRVKVLPRGAIPDAALRMMARFDIVGLRYDDRRGD